MHSRVLLSAGSAVSIAPDLEFFILGASLQPSSTICMYLTQLVSGLLAFVTAPENKRIPQQRCTHDVAHLLCSYPA
jgi:hypothetical protein